MPTLDVVAVGELNADLILTAPRITPEFGHDKPLEDYALTLGSSTALAAHGLGRLGARVGFVGVAGQDAFGELVVRHLREAGVDVSRIQLRQELRTGLTVSLSEPGDRALLTYPGSIAALRLADMDWDYLRSFRHLHLASYFILTALRQDIPALFRRAKEYGLTTSLDTGWDEAGAFGADLEEALPYVDVFLPNAEEARAITGLGDIRQALADLAQRIPTVAVKLGAQGAMAQRGEEFAQAAGFSVRARDTTGCGDAFDAGFLFGLLQGLPLSQCLTLGNACGALVATQLGGAAGFPTLTELTRFLRERGAVLNLPDVANTAPKGDPR